MRAARSLFLRNVKQLPVRPDLIHYVNVPVFPVAVPYVLTVFDLRDKDQPSLNRGVRNLSGAMFRSAALRNARKVIGISEFTAQRIAAHYPHARGRIRAIPLGVDPAPTVPAGESSPHPRPYVLAVGHLEPRKNFVRLVEAFTQACADTRLAGTDLVIVGHDYGQGHAVRDAAVRSAMAARIQITGRVSQEQLERYYRHASLFAFPSLYEGFGLPALEAMQYGVSVLTSNVCSFPEIVPLGEAMFDPLCTEAIAGALVRGVADAHLRARIIKAQVGRVRELTWERCARATAEVYREVLDTSTTTGGA
jgi:alpha-1,3-rhamnosyl/mannosyltransferase